MKISLLLSLLLFAAGPAQAEEFPQLYCVSVKSFENVNQLNVFTNKKGTLRMSLQYFAVSDDGQNSGNFDTNILQTVTQLNFDSSTGLMSNGAGKLAFQVNPNALTPAEAEEIMNSGNRPGFDFLNMTGHKIIFNKYYKGTMVEFNLKGRRGYWDAELMKAFKAGVKEYICGNVIDVKGPRPSVLDQFEKE